MPLTDSEIAAQLAPAGLLFIRRVEGEVRQPHLPPGRSPSSARPEDGRFDSRPDEIPDVNDPDMPVKVNASWLRMASEFGLFNKDREFLLLVNYADEEDEWEDHSGWVQVRLLDEWDLAASGVEQLRSWIAGTFTPRFVPEFRMVSLDGQTVIETTVWGNGTVSTIAIRPSATAPARGTEETARG
ncbi:hypothetical protein ACFXJ8_39095 [Nonomuraea sp. NPDC059194]|uniref:hypothetical protein n=1 Tax=Nonomuraea sp. NPDC059194 TaxID=3346764 RepID=UPI00368FB260